MQSWLPSPSHPPSSLSPLLSPQGYKFNIFYPDLIDRSTPPSYHIERDGSDGETCLIRFHAGPPYEDIVSG